MALRYSARMRSRQTLPRLWLLSDARNDAVLERALLGLPRGSGFIFRHYHLPPAERRARFRSLARLCRKRGIVAAWAGPARAAQRAGAGGCYGAPGVLARGPASLRIAAVHSLREMAEAARGRADAVLLSPAFPTRSHPGGPWLGALRFLVQARQSPLPVVALGGMNRRSARRLPGFAWAGIDGLSHKTRRIPVDS